MRWLLSGVAVLLLAGCAAPWATGGPGAPVAKASPRSAGNAAALSGDACRALTASDVQAAVGTQVTQLPATASQAGNGAGGAAGTMISGCSYTASNQTVAGASLFLYRDMPIDYFANLPGYQTLTGIGDRAYLQSQSSIVIGSKGHTTFQLVLISSADPAIKDQKLRALAQAVASRL